MAKHFVLTAHITADRCVPAKSKQKFQDVRIQYDECEQDHKNASALHTRGKYIFKDYRGVQLRISCKPDRSIRRVIQSSAIPINRRFFICSSSINSALFQSIIGVIVCGKYHSVTCPRSKTMEITHELSINYCQWQ